MKEIILTGDRPTGRLHLGHYAGSLRERLRLQDEGNYKKYYVMIADAQALTDNAKNVAKIRENIIEVAIDYMSIGLDPKKVIFFIQSLVPELTEFTFYFANLVTVSRLLRNPTVKEEIALRGFEKSLPVGFAIYPISQASDVLAFNATLVPVGDDQLPVMEQVNEIVRAFNSTYKNILIEPKTIVPKNKNSSRLVGIDGKAKMSKSLGNCIYLADDSKTVYEKVFNMYTDPNHLKVTDKGKVEGNVVFTYLDVFSSDAHFKKYLPEYRNLAEMKAHYKKGGLGDVKCKKFLFDIIEELLTPIREKRKILELNIPEIYKILREGSKKASKTAKINLKNLKTAMDIDYNF